MILRRCGWFLVFFLHIRTICGQNAANEDWVPIPSPNERSDREGRVLNIDANIQRTKFFPDNQPNVRQQQYLQDVKPNLKSDHPYRFENVPAHQNTYLVDKFVPQFLPTNLPRRPSYDTEPKVFNASLFRSKTTTLPQIVTTPRTQENNKESIQLLYVPYENLSPSPQPLYQQQQSIVPQQFSQNLPLQSQPHQEFALPQYQPQHVVPATVDPHKQYQLKNIEQDFIRQALDAHKLTQQLQAGQQVVLEPISTTTTTIKPKRRKAHQPPLAVYMEKLSQRNEGDIDEILNVLKSSKSISVLDNIGPNSPQVFVGPSNLSPPDGYKKFPLPYLSNLERNRIERKIDNLPFFVAPLSYKAPKGYSKIPLPSPHVGSVVVSNRETDEVLIKPTQIYQNVKFIDTTTTPRPTESFDLYQIPGLEPNGFHASPVTRFEAENFKYNNDQTNRYNYKPTEEVPQTYQIDNESKIPQLQPQNSQVVYQNYQLDVKPTVPTTTTNIPSTSSTTTQPTSTFPLYNFDTVTKTQHPFRQIINQQELHQINNQFLQPEPTAPVTFKYDESLEITTTVPITRGRKRQRGRPTTSSSPPPPPPPPPAPTPTTNFYQPEKYTVLEEFSVKPTTERYTSDIETIPAQTFKLPVEPSTFEQYQQEAPINNVETIKSQQILDEPSNAQETYIDSYLPGFIDNLQDQSIKSLLVPNLLVPTTQKLFTPSTEEPTTRLIYTQPPTITTTTTTTTEHYETTTTRRTRGRQRHNYSRQSTTTTSPATRRTVNRRRPQHQYRTTTESYDQYDYSTTRRAPHTRQRFRTRGRPVATENTIIERQSPKPENVFQSYEPQSYMQFVQEEKPPSTNKPETVTVTKEYLQEYEDETKSKPVVDIQITHPVLEKESHLIIKPTVESQYVQIQSGGVLHNGRDSTTATTARTSRVRGRSRFNTRSTTTTSQPITTTTTIPTPIHRLSDVKSDESDDDGEEEFYGFIRPPNFNRPATTVKVYTTTSETPTTFPNYRYDEEIKPIQFIGEIRPKYQNIISTTTTTEEPEIVTRARTRVRTNPQTNEIRKTNNRGRSRGHAHFQVPDQLKSKSDDNDVEGGNYPPAFFARNTLISSTTIPITTTPVATTTTTQRSFQITVDPFAEEDESVESEEDQSPHASYHVPKIVETPAEWAEVVPSINQLQFEEKIQAISTDAPTPLGLVQEQSTTQSTTSTTAPTTTPKKRGVWKLVAQRPINDPLAVAESQNYQSVINIFDDLPKTTTEKSSMLSVIYNLFGNENLNSTESVDNSSTITNLEETPVTTTPISPTFPEEITESVTETVEVTENWKNAKTSTSTEISHETEICFRGRCLRSSDKKSGH